MSKPRLRWFLGMLHTITFVSLPNLLNQRKHYKAIKLLQKEILNCQTRKIMITAKKKSASDENSPTK
jgi:hypothetical protein